MRSDVLKTYKTLHTWTGLIGGMALFICFYAGALTMFKEPLDRWATPPQQKLPWVSAARLPVLIQAVLEAHPEAADSFVIHLQETESTLAPLSWEEHGDVVDRHFYATLDGEGGLHVVERTPSRMAELIDLLHRTAGIPGGDDHDALGIYVMGGVSVLYVLALFSGLILLLPTLVKDFFAIRRGKNTKRFWLDAHNVIGITSLPFHIVIALTAIVFAFHDQFYDSLEKVVYGEQPMFERGSPEPGPKSPLDGLVLPAALIAQVGTMAPDFVPREIIYSDLGEAGASVRVTGESDRHMLRDANRGLVMFGAYSGQVTNADYLPGYEDRWTTLINTFFALHFGSYGGVGMRWVYFALGVGGAFLFYSGNLLWVESRRRRQRKNANPVRQNRSTVAMASATVGVCWGSVAGLALAMVAGKWSGVFGYQANAAYIWVYYGVFLVSIFWAFVAGPAKGAVHLLWLCALACLGVALSGALAMWPVPGLWLHTSTGTLGVELSALVWAGVFMVAARRVSVRGRSLGTDSVWSASKIKAKAVFETAGHP